MRYCHEGLSVCLSLCLCRFICLLVCLFVKTTAALLLFDGGEFMKRVLWEEIAPFHFNGVRFTIIARQFRYQTQSIKLQSYL